MSLRTRSFASAQDVAWRLRRRQNGSSCRLPVASQKTKAAADLRRGTQIGNPANGQRQLQGKIKLPAASFRLPVKRQSSRRFAQMNAELEIWPRIGTDKHRSSGCNRESLT